ncbi:hypothetical protein ElyMa_003544100 [Elysia marginata]|uniref:Uncharacterized protein n=1 Tax=Elysia marginata TaxID=1093978 RepID=A0AAV4EK04_9GAST|nr:hypothetical protein ElyMa_003544100 [Elysia marginata]
MERNPTATIGLTCSDRNYEVIIMYPDDLASLAAQSQAINVLASVDNFLSATNVECENEALFSPKQQHCQNTQKCREQFIAL